jgi:hypothetical protein
MSPDFRVFSESESRNEALMRQARPGGQVLVVKGPENDVRGVIGPWCGSDALVPSANAFVTVPGDRIGEVQGIITERELTKMGLRHRANENLEAAEMNQDASMNWDAWGGWGAWGGMVLS